MHRRINIKRLATVVLLSLVAIIIATLTVGRDIYNGFTGAGLLSFAIVNLAGYLFFLFLPVTLSFILYVNSGENLLLLNAIAVGTAFLSEVVDYLIGYSLSYNIINQLIGKRRYTKAKEELKKYGNLTVFVFNFLPVSSPIISLAAGMLKYRIKDTIIFTILGLGLKYAVLTLIFHN